MFTADQIKQAHDEIKSGADFATYIRKIKQMGIIAFETWTKDSHTKYFCNDGHQTQVTAQYDELIIAEVCEKEKFRHYLKTHQQGGIDYYTFCKHCAETGIEKWVVNLVEMSCTYYDKAGNPQWVEEIPY